MKFYTEQTGCEKTSLSDLQGSWENFKHTLLCMHSFPSSYGIIFHMDEAATLEMVSGLKKMKYVYLFIMNMCLKVKWLKS